MGDYAPKYHFGDHTNWLTSTVVTGGQVVEITGDGTVGTTGGASALVVGVASRDAAIGKRIEVVRVGIQRLVASAAITRGAALKTAAQGRVAPMTVGTDPHTQLVGIALTAATNPGDVIDVLWKA